MQKDNSAAAGAGPFAGQQRAHAALIEDLKDVAQSCHRPLRYPEDNNRIQLVLLEAVGALLASETRVAALREVLKPFAALAEDRNLSNHPDSYAPRPSRGRPNMGDYRRALAALASPPRDGE